VPIGKNADDLTDYGRQTTQKEVESNHLSICKSRSALRNLESQTLSEN